MTTPRNKLISKAALSVLQRMKDAEDADNLDDAEIVCEGRYCYVGLDSISKAAVNELLVFCLIRDDSDQGGKVERYTLNEEGQAMVSDPTYVPKIVVHLKQREAGQ